jgi:hypothetical protein
MTKADPPPHHLELEINGGAGLHLRLVGRGRQHLAPGGADCAIACRQRGAARLHCTISMCANNGYMAVQSQPRPAAHLGRRTGVPDTTIDEARPW